MAHYDGLFKHLGEYSPDQLAALALNTEQVRVRDSLNTEPEAEAEVVKGFSCQVAELFE